MYTKFIRKIRMKDYSADLVTDGMTKFIDVIDVGCEGANGFRWLMVEFVMKTAINVD
jgi:hypothetical protein